MINIFYKYISLIYSDLGLHNTVFLFFFIGYIVGNVLPASFLRYLFTRFLKWR